MHRRLHGEDAAWLHMDDPTNPMVVSGLLELEEVLSDERARELLERLAKIEPFSSRIVEPEHGVGVPSWEPAGPIAVADHLERVRLGSSSDVELSAFLNRTVSTGLDPKRPLWKMILIDRPDHGTGVLFRVHHAIADGYGLLGLLGGLSDTPPVIPSRPPRPGKAEGPSPLEQVRRSARAAKHLLSLPPDPATLLHAPLGGQKRVAWSRPVPLATVKRIGAANSATVNDVLTAVMTGALRRYLGRRGEDCDPIELHAMVPVNVRRPDSPLDLSNCFGLLVLGLPVGIADPVARIGSVHHRMMALKDQTAEAMVAYGLLSMLGYAPRPVEDSISRYFGRKASLVLTNLMGPRERLSLAGIPITRMMFWVPEAAHLGLGVSIFSYAGDVTVCVLSDEAIIPDPDVLMADFHAELDLLP